MTPEEKGVLRRRETLRAAADVLEALHAEGIIQASHGIGVGIHYYLRKVAEKVPDAKAKTA